MAVLAGRDLPLTTLKAWLDEADWIYAADGAADLCLSVGCKPDVVVGDLDSISEGAREWAPDLRFRPDQEFTDADKVLDEVLADGHRETAVCGLEGDLPDHEIAALASCVRARRKGLRIDLKYRRGTARIVLPGEAYVRLVSPGRRVSVLPMLHGDGLTLRGVEWPLEAVPIEPAGKASISNRSLGGPVEVSVESGAVWVFVADE